MFSAVYLVCMLNQPCMFFVDPGPYPTLEICNEWAENNKAKHQASAQRGELAPHTSEHQCINWDKA